MTVVPYNFYTAIKLNNAQQTMVRLLSSLALAFITILCACFITAEAQTMFPTEDKDNVISSAIGVESGTLFSIGYQHTVHAESLNKNMSFFANTTVPAGEELFNDIRVQLGASTFLLHNSNFNVSTALALTTTHTQNTLYNGTGFGLDVLITAGYYKSTWFAAAEAGADRTLLTRLSHSDYYKDYFYQEAKDGWYPNSAGNLRIGVRGGIKIGRAELGLRVGAQTTMEFNKRVIPFFAGLQAGYTLPSCSPKK